jgi:nucleotide-binding universal stress UspA family protein
MQAAVIPITPAIQLKHVLFATDYSDASIAALPVAAAIVRRFDARLTLAHFWMPPPLSLTAPESAAYVADAGEQVAAHGMARLRCSYELLGLEPKSVVAQSDPAEGVLALAAAQVPDLIVMGTHGRTGLKRFLLGSVAECIFRQARCPVLTVGPHADGRFQHPVAVKHILVPTDLSPESAEAVPYVALLAAEFDAHVSVLHVLPRETGGNPAANELVEPIRRRMKQMFSSCLGPRCDPQFLVRFGPEADSIVAAAQACDADLIVMALRPGYGIGSGLRTTTAYNVVVKADCPVLTVKAHR